MDETWKPKAKWKKASHKGPHVIPFTFNAQNRHIYRDKVDQGLPRTGWANVLEGDS